MPPVARSLPVRVGFVVFVPYPMAQRRHFPDYRPDMKTGVPRIVRPIPRPRYREQTADSAGAYRPACFPGPADRMQSRTPDDERPQEHERDGRGQQGHEQYLFDIHGFRGALRPIR